MGIEGMQKETHLEIPMYEWVAVSTLLLDLSTFMEPGRTHLLHVCCSSRVYQSIVTRSECWERKRIETHQRQNELSEG
jgi:hypothetical protein